MPVGEGWCECVCVGRGGGGGGQRTWLLLQQACWCGCFSGCRIAQAQPSSRRRGAAPNPVAARTCVVYCSAATNGASTRASSQTRRDLQTGHAQGRRLACDGTLPTPAAACSCPASRTQLQLSCLPCKHASLHYAAVACPHLSKACGSLEARLSTPTTRCCTYIGAAAMERAPPA